MYVELGTNWILLLFERLPKSKQGHFYMTITFERLFYKHSDATYLPFERNIVRNTVAIRRHCIPFKSSEMYVQTQFDWWPNFSTIYFGAFLFEKL